MKNMQRKNFRLTIKKTYFFAQQMNCLLFNVNFTHRRFVGFFKTYLNWWGQKMFVVKWNLLFKSFIQRALFVSKNSWGLFFISTGLAWGSFFKKNLTVFLSYFLYDRYFVFKSRFVLNFFNLAKVKFIIFSEICVKMENVAYRTYNKHVLYLFGLSQKNNG